MSEASRSIPFTTAGAWRGFTQAQGLVPGVLVWGMAYGLLANQAGLSSLEAVLMSAFVYSGTAQLAALTFLSSGPTLTIGALLAMIGAVLLLNARYLLYGAALRPWLGGAPTVPVYGSLFVMGDTSWALAMKAHAAGERDGAFVFGAGCAMYLPWTLGTLAGSLGGALVPNPAVLGLDFFLVAFAAAMAAGMVSKTWAGLRDDVAVGIVALVVAVATDRLAPGGFAIIAAGLAGGAVAWARFKPAEARA